MAREEGVEGGCCNCCLRFTLTCGFAALFLWLALRTNSPTLSIEQFDLFLLNSTSARNPNLTIFFDLKLKNRNKDKGVFYENLTLTFSYPPNQTLANATIRPFYQGHEHSARRPMAVDASAGKWITAAEKAVAVNGSAVFKVDLKTAVRYKVVFWKTKRKKMEMRAELAVNGEGKLVRGKKKGVKLTSAAGIGHGCYRTLGFFLVFLVWCIFGGDF